MRVAVESPDSITASAVSARDEIGRAVAAKIRETQSADDLAKVTEEVLPEIEKFLESPEEKRLRRMRAGSILSSVGIGAAIAMTIVSVLKKEEDLLVLGGLGLVAFFIGLGFSLNGVFLTVPKQSLADRSSEADSQRQLDGIGTSTNDLKLPQSTDLFSSVTENTTQHLKEKEPVSRG
ncbi:MAG: hypothetical protein ACT4O9_07800 [Blastocatellia bacterium]